MPDDEHMKYFGGDRVMKPREDPPKFIGLIPMIEQYAKYWDSTTLNEAPIFGFLESEQWVDMSTITTVPMTPIEYGTTSDPFVSYSTIADQDWISDITFTIDLQPEVWKLE